MDDHTAVGVASLLLGWEERKKKRLGEILSKLLAAKLGPHLHNILDDTQFCQPGKEIGELILSYQALIDDCERSDSEAALAFLDFEKAFDSVDHEFTFTMLQAVGLPKEFIQWAKLAFTNTQACLIINGKRSPFFPLPGGGRQGDEETTYTR